MIVFVIALLAGLTFWAFMYLKNPLRDILGFFFTILLLGSVVLTTLNFSSHWGMKQASKTKTETIYTAGQTDSLAGMILAQRIGTKSKDYVFIYRDTKDAKKATTHFVPNTKKAANAVKKSANYKLVDADKATVTTKTTRWVWQSDLAKLLFGFSGINNTLVSEKTTVNVPKDTWVVLSPADAKKLAAKQTQMAKNPEAAAAQSQQAAQMQAGVQAKVAAYMAKHPTANAEAYANKVAAQMTADAMKAMLK
jgi:hypothetical protein